MAGYTIATDTGVVLLREDYYATRDEAEQRVERSPLTPKGSPIVVVTTEQALALTAMRKAIRAEIELELERVYRERTSELLAAGDRTLDELELTDDERRELISPGEVAELELEAGAVDDAELALALERRRELAAELRVLADYDRMREGWYDFGGGQRWKELARRRRELDELEQQLGRSLPELELGGPSRLAVDELAAAFDRVGRPRLERARAAANTYQTRSSRRTLETWERLEQRLCSPVRLAQAAKEGVS